MDFARFRHSLSQPEPPAALSVQLRALWWDAKGNWSRAHDLINNEPGPNAAWVHAYLHRKEGDHANARYWYNQAGKPVCETSLSQEWEEIARVMAG
jgi:YD repeat-containing protein